MSNLCSVERVSIAQDAKGLHSEPDLARRIGRVVLAIVLAFCSVASTAPSAFANPRPLPFTYQHEQLGEGDAEFEQFADFTPVRALSATTGEPVYYGLLTLQTEFEYGISDRLELGLYVTFVPSASGDFSLVPRASQGNGLKQRLRWQLAETGAWPIDLSIYGEVVENERELELEGKLIVQRRFGRLRAIANLGAEQEFYYDGKHDLVLNPSAGVTFEASPKIQPGFEWWMQAEYPEEDPPSPRPFVLGPHHYLGPVLLLNFGRLWWSNGAYARVSGFGHTLQPGEGFGRVWIRSVIGFGI